MYIMQSYSFNEYEIIITTFIILLAIHMIIQMDDLIVRHLRFEHKANICARPILDSKVNVMNLAMIQSQDLVRLL